MLNTLPSNFASAVTPFVALGRAPVGEENTDLKTSSLKPLEEGAESARSDNRRQSNDQTADADSEHKRADGATKESEARELQERQEQISQLAKRDREVRAHERAHAAVGGQYAGAPRYETVRGPDGVNYAVAGEVSIDTSKIPGDPQASLAKALQVHAAATAPSDPSAQDRRVAAEASRMAADARAELAQLLREEQVQKSAQAKAKAQSNHSAQPGDNSANPQRFYPAGAPLTAANNTAVNLRA